MKYMNKVSKLIIAVGLALVFIISSFAVSVYADEPGTNPTQPTSETDTTSTTETTTQATTETTTEAPVDPNLKVYKAYGAKLKQLNTKLKLKKSDGKLVYCITKLNKDNTPELIVGVRKSSKDFRVLYIFTYFKNKVKDIGIHPETKLDNHDVTSQLRICKNGYVICEEYEYESFHRLVYEGSRIIGLSSLYEYESKVYNINKKGKANFVTELEMEYEVIRNNSGFEDYSYEQISKNKKAKSISEKNYNKLCKKYCTDIKLQYFEYNKKAYKSLSKGNTNYKGQKKWKLKTGKFKF